MVIVYAGILFAGAFLFLALGVEIHNGNTKLIHDYHQKNVKESERQEYGRAFAKGIFAICTTLLLSGSFALFGEDRSYLIASLVILLAGLILSIIILIGVQIKYNGRLF